MKFGKHEFFKNAIGEIVHAVAGVPRAFFADFTKPNGEKVSKEDSFRAYVKSYNENGAHDDMIAPIDFAALEVREVPGTPVDPLAQLKAENAAARAEDQAKYDALAQQNAEILAMLKNLTQPKV